MFFFSFSTSIIFYRWTHFLVFGFYIQSPLFTNRCCPFLQFVVSFTVNTDWTGILFVGTFSFVSEYTINSYYQSDNLTRYKSNVEKKNQHAYWECFICNFGLKFYSLNSVVNTVINHRHFTKISNNSKLCIHIFICT